MSHCIHRKSRQCCPLRNLCAKTMSDRCATANNDMWPIAVLSGNYTIQPKPWWFVENGCTNRWTNVSMMRDVMAAKLFLISWHHQIIQLILTNLNLKVWVNKQNKINLDTTHLTSLFTWKFFRLFRHYNSAKLIKRCQERYLYWYLKKIFHDR